MERSDKLEIGKTRRRDGKQGSPLSVDVRLVPWCVGGMAALAVLWTALVVWNETQYGDHANWTLACQAVGKEVFFALPGIILIPIILATGIKLAINIGKDVWGLINFHFPIIGRKYIERRTSEWEAKGRGEGIEIGRGEGIEIGRGEGIEIGRGEGIQIGRGEGIQIGESRKNAEWSAWNNRRLEAEKAGAPFNEPPPGDSA